MKASDIIIPALQSIGVIAQSETPAASEQADALTALNNLLASWSAERLNVPTRNIYNGSLAGGSNSYLIGTGAAWNTARPLKIVSANSFNNSVRIPCQMETTESWAQIVDQAATGPVVKSVYYDPAFPLGRIYCYPTPNAAFTLELFMVQALASFPDYTTTDVPSVPAEYARALIYNLAVDLAPAFGATLQPSMAMSAGESKAAIRKMNAEGLGADQASGVINAIPTGSQA